MNKIAESELILNKDGSIYHLNLLPEELADTVITVGDPDRVQEVSKYFDAIEVKKQKREFATHTGRIGSRRLSVISTGIGTDNIDIVINELDALANIDFNSRSIKPALSSLQIIRMGTSGALQPDIPVDSLLLSSHAIGLDGMMHFYRRRYTEAETGILHSFNKKNPLHTLGITPYIATASKELSEFLSEGMKKGITITCNGFYGPQGRVLRGEVAYPGLIEQLASFSYLNSRITNFEMETAGIYGLSALLGHKACAINAIVANRVDKTFSKEPAKIIDKMIQTVLERLSDH